MRRLVILLALVGWSACDDGDVTLVQAADSGSTAEYGLGSDPMSECQWFCSSVCGQVCAHRGMVVGGCDLSNPDECACECDSPGAR